MPIYRPSILISDAYGSTKDLTWFHRGGKCYVKQHTPVTYTPTPAREEYLDVHRRALAAWRTLDHQVQLQWNEYGKQAISHRPPYDNTTHISGHNLFVSAYHGFYTLGNEHVPEPKPFGPFPVFAMEFLSAVEVGGSSLLLRFKGYCGGLDHPERYRILMKLQLSAPGGGRRQTLFRNVLASSGCTAGECVIEFVISDYLQRWDLERLPGYGGHCQYIVLDSETGYRDQYRNYDFQFDLPL